MPAIPGGASFLAPLRERARGRRVIAPLYGSMLGLVVAAQLGTAVFAAYLCVAAAWLFANEWRRG